MDPADKRLSIGRGGIAIHLFGQDKIHGFHPRKTYEQTKQTLGYRGGEKDELQ